jgi:antitoxin (DNA-binding transcriptional repressor) of toxin-antitoxin stability system
LFVAQLQFWSRSMTTISLQDAQVQLPELIHGLAPGDEVMITENNLAIARIVSASQKRPHRKLGTLHGTVRSIAADFDAPLEQFKDYISRSTVAIASPSRRPGV